MVENYSITSLDFDKLDIYIYICGVQKKYIYFVLRMFVAVQRKGTNWGFDTIFGFARSSPILFEARQRVCCCCCCCYINQLELIFEDIQHVVSKKRQ